MSESNRLPCRGVMLLAVAMSFCSPPARADERAAAFEQAPLVLRATVSAVRVIGQTRSMPPTSFGEVSFERAVALRGVLPAELRFGFSVRGPGPVPFQAGDDVLVAASAGRGGEPPVILRIVPATAENLAIAQRAVGGARPAPVPAAANDPARRLADANNRFALELYAELSAKPGNLFFSPYSIHEALSMSFAGARARTAAQMARVLRLPEPADATHDAYAALRQRILQDNRAGDRKLYELVVANAMFGQKDYPFHEPFRRIVLERYGAGLFPVDFVRDTEGARLQINDWVARQTSDRIQDLLARGTITDLTRLVLANAIYFKGGWESEFPSSATREQPFHLARDKTISVPMMRQQQRFGYAETDTLQALELRYSGGGLSMIVLLPRAIDGLAALEQTLTADALEALRERMNPRETEVFVPRFRFSSEFHLNDKLQALGMTDAFDPDRADLSGIATVERLYISAVVHKAFVDVNEEGTEAAAATGVVVGITSAPLRPQPVVFRADRPFLFLIRHNPSGTVLLLGRLLNPQS
jgi:serpin B